MNQNSNAILTLCSHISAGDGIFPLEPKEYSQLAADLYKMGKAPRDLFDFTADDFKTYLKSSPEEIERIQKLLDRNASLSFALSEYRNMGIEAVTRADSCYPQKLKKKLSNGCPPIFYCAGDLSLLQDAYIGYVGVRTVSEEDSSFAKEAVNRTTALGYGVVSGGAKGIDTISGAQALMNGANVIEYLSDSMLKKLRKSDIVRYIQDGKLLLMSVAKPDAAFHVGFAMMRNRYIYAQSEATVVVRADLNKGGTWAGAVENLKKNWCPTLCWDHSCPGNQALIQKGAFPISTDWDGSIPELILSENKEEPDQYEQTSLFDL